MAATLLACGLSPDGASVALFAQGAVREHTELAWLLSCLAPLGLLQRMTQFKAKAGSRGGGSGGGVGGGGLGAGAGGEGANLGLLAYPVLQAADILLYRASHVPVGDDQRQHLELARSLAAGANTAWGGEAHGGAPAAPLFPLPATLAPWGGASGGSGGCGRVMSLRDGTRKMSKSDPHDGARVNLDDSDDAIAAKVAAAKTDSAVGFAPIDARARPEKANLVALLAALRGEEPRDVAERYAAAQARAFKADLTDALVHTVAPIRAELTRLRADPGAVDAVLREGADRARGLAQDTMRRVRAAAGYA